MELLNRIREKQEQYWAHFRSYEWLRIKSTEHDILKSNIGFAFFGSPIVPDESDGDATYNQEQHKFIDMMLELIMVTKKEHSTQDIIWVSFVCVSCKFGEQLTEVPVICVPKYDGTCNPNEDMFIDSNFRVYKNWQDFLENNKLPACLMYYPRGGKYFTQGEQLQLDMGFSPEAKLGSQILNILDIVSGLQYCFDSNKLPSSPLATAGICAATMAAGCYNVYRNTAKLYDRKVHMQSIGLDNVESRNYYLGIVGSGVCIASSGITLAKYFKKDKSTDKASESDFIPIKKIDGIVNSIGKFNEIAKIIQRVKDSKELTLNDTVQVTAHVLFFTNCVISTDLVDELVKKAGIGNANMLNVVKEMVQGAMEITSTIRKITTIYKFVSPAIMCIIEKNEPLKNMWNSWNKKINTVKQKLHKVFRMKTPSTNGTGDSTYFAGGNPDFLKIVSTTIVTEENILQNSLAKSSSPTSQPDVIQENSQHMTSQSDSTEISDQTDVESREGYSDAVIEISKKFADAEQCESPEDFLRYLRFTCKFIKRECLKEMELYKKCLQITKKRSPLVTEEEFDKDYGIETNRFQYFLQQVMKDFKNGNGYLKLKIAYSNRENFDLHEEITTDDGHLSFIAIDNEQGRAPEGWFNKDQYFGKAEQLMREETNESNVAIEEDGGCAIMVVREAEKIINVTTMKKPDGKISGIAIMLQNCS